MLYYIRKKRKRFVMTRREEYLSFHCPRWEEFPDVELYADQVLSVIQRHVSFFDKEIEMTFTSNMINNYVKQKIVKPPVNKRYDRVHLAYFMVVCIFKQFMTISELCRAIAVLMEKCTVKELYDVFCEELESALRATFAPESYKISYSENETKEAKIIRAAALTFANLAYAKYLVNGEE